MKMTQILCPLVLGVLLMGTSSFASRNEFSTGKNIECFMEIGFHDSLHAGGLPSERVSLRTMTLESMRSVVSDVFGAESIHLSGMIPGNLAGRVSSTMKFEARPGYPSTVSELLNHHLQSLVKTMELNVEYQNKTMGFSLKLNGTEIGSDHISANYACGMRNPAPLGVYLVRHVGQLDGKEVIAEFDCYPGQMSRQPDCYQ